MTKILLLLIFALAGTGIVLLQLDIIRKRYQQKKQRKKQKEKAKGIPLRVIARTDMSHQHFSIRLQAVNHQPLQDFQPGQYITLLTQTQLDPGKQQKRSYSLASWQDKTEFYELGIQREENGQVSRWLHENLQPGSIINALPPKGDFFMSPQAAPHIVLIAGGIGITPLRAMVHKFVAQKPGDLSAVKTLHLFYAARSMDQMCYLDELIKLSELHYNFYFYPTLSKIEENWQGDIGRLNSAELIQQTQRDVEPFPDKSNIHYYLCGPQNMMDNMTQDLSRLGVSRQHIHSERFGLNLAATGDEEFSITLGSNKAFSFQKQRSLLQALEQEGIKIESECRSGECGQCKIKLRQGKVKQLIEPDITLASTEFLACCSVPESDLLIEI
ncbi:MAG: 2Fe-2S iron-sulfur cluster-binding protein [Bermanella sp.]